MAYYAEQVCKFKMSSGIQLVDFLDIHFYPQANGVTSKDESDATVQLRFNAPMSLYNSGYTDQSWINQQIYLIPRMKQYLSQYCPAMKLSISEYNFGDETLWSAALVTAEVLAIYGREGVDMASIWTVPRPGTPVENAFKMFLNYDGKLSNLFGSSVSAISSSNSSVPAYAILNTNAQKIYVLMFNKVAVSSQVRVVFKNVVVKQNGMKYSFGKGSGNLAPGGSVPISNGEFSTSLNPWEAQLVVVPL